MFNKAKPPSTHKNGTVAPTRTSPGTHSHASVHPVLQLQKTIGNRAVAALVQQGQLSPDGVVQRMMRREKSEKKRDQDNNNNNNSKGGQSEAPEVKSGIDDDSLILLLNSLSDYTIDLVYEMLSKASPEQLKRLITGKLKNALKKFINDAEFEIGFENLEISEVSNETAQAGKLLIAILERINQTNKGSGEDLTSVLVELTEFMNTQGKSLQGLTIAGKSVADFLEGLIKGNDECNNVLTSQAIPDLQLAIAGTPKVVALKILLNKAGVGIK